MHIHTGELSVTRARPYFAFEAIRRILPLASLTLMPSERAAR